MECPIIKTGRSYDHAFKEYVAKQIVEEGKKASDLAREMTIPYKTMLRWGQDYRKKLKVQRGEEDAYITPSELKKREQELLKQIKDLEEENEILKKGAHLHEKPEMIF